MVKEQESAVKAVRLERLVGNIGHVRLPTDDSLLTASYILAPTGFFICCLQLTAPPCQVSAAARARRQAAHRGSSAATSRLTEEEADQQEEEEGPEVT